MPRVTEQYIQRRRQEILEAAGRCFARDGFHATSMDDVIDAAGVSTSVFYRWFRGKDELVIATVTDVLRGMVVVLDDILEVDPPPPLADAVERVLAATLTRMTRDGHDTTALAVQVWTEALRNPEIHQLIAHCYEQLRDRLAELIRRHQALGAIPAEVDPRMVARPLFSLFPGFVVQRLLLGPEDPKLYAQAAQALLRA
ncbi:MAG TPA: TetR/AcrR family transcriptional regulator [Pseudonocardia sp.]|jgi:AcrR family transcriptional regulator|uniref:TetR/AcrR family transcriptional regulator n=1 Tax=Pseudonocardia sp. TaxID=60912 RepID=UPI002F3FD89B